jgi:hypothetical protein
MLSILTYATSRDVSIHTGRAGLCVW